MRTLLSILIVALALALSLAPAPAAAWTLVQSPASATFNGVAIADEHLAIAVGNDGTIVHFVDGDSGTLMPSGTTTNLLDVYAVDADFAVAAGINVVLVWDGVSWETLVENTSGTDIAYSPVWASPDRDLVLYGTLGQEFNFVCPHVPGAAQQGFCRTFGQEILALCGQDGEITAVRRDGAIFRVNEDLVELGDTFGPAHEPPAPLDLRAAWITPGACGLSTAVLPGIFAIEGGDEVLVFDGDGWIDTGLDLPPGQELIWLGGTGGNFVLAVGFEPSAGKGPSNDGVIWIYDSETWSESTDLPPGTPGLTDIAVRLEYSEIVFASGFEPAATKNARPGLAVDILAAAESGRGLLSEDLFPLETVDLSVDKRLISEEIIKEGARLTFAVDAFNAGPHDVRFVDILDGFNVGPGEMATIESFTCTQAVDDSLIGPGGVRAPLGEVGVDLLPARGSLNCTMVVVTSSSSSFRNRASVTSYFASDVNISNNSSEVVRP